jgi:hypothetical protein
MGPFEDVTVDLDSLPGPLVALVGRNGAGKTSALELAYAGAQYRETPTQGTLAERSTNKGSLVESWIGDIHIKHLVGDGKVLVQRGSAVLVPSGGVTPFDLWAEKSLPPKDLFHAGVFGAQGSSGFLGMTPGPRDRRSARGSDRAQHGQYLSPAQHEIQGPGFQPGKPAHG